MNSYSFKVFSLVLVGSFLAFGASGATTANVSATVTAQNVSISLNGTDGSVAYGTIALNASQDTTPTGVNDTESIQNNGNVTEDFTITGANSANWTINTSNSTQDNYIHQVCTVTCDSSPSWVSMTTGALKLADDIAASGTLDFDLKVTTPQDSTVYTQQTLGVTVTASAS